MGDSTSGAKAAKASGNQGAPFSGAADAAVYRWVDEQGKVHYSDLVPERYRNTAKPVDAPPAEPTPEQQRAALERAQSEKA